MAKKHKSNKRGINVREFIVTPHDRMRANLKAADKAVEVALVQTSQDNQNNSAIGASFMDNWERALDKLVVK